MKCPIHTCKSWTFVLETRTRKTDGLVTRRYECANAHRFTTLETPVKIDAIPKREKS